MLAHAPTTTTVAVAVMHFTAISNIPDHNLKLDGLRVSLLLLLLLLSYVSSFSYILLGFTLIRHLFNWHIPLLDKTRCEVLRT